MFTVYKIFDESNALLYVGCTKRYQERQWSHKRRFYHLKIRFESEEFKMATAAARRERELIKTLKPLHNRVAGGYTNKVHDYH